MCSEEGSGKGTSGEGLDNGSQLQVLDMQLFAPGHVAVLDSLQRLFILRLSEEGGGARQMLGGGGRSAVLLAVHTAGFPTSSFCVLPARSHMGVHQSQASSALISAAEIVLSDDSNTIHVCSIHAVPVRGKASANVSTAAHAKDCYAVAVVEQILCSPNSARGLCSAGPSGLLVVGEGGILHYRHTQAVGRLTSAVADAAAALAFGGQTTSGAGHHDVGIKKDGGLTRAYDANEDCLRLGEHKQR
ncbi:hypothetical protein CYMTET_14718 [Cymbomonas tetramitiformis]|uniref:Uncharacterized protein n=1 Tax=Cymbomonas tetramitiformis TaxID=36881 RepID=A0AAE0LA40_9CHLO|nr:hypothetical protein CYMTET_14718 [Cymbomonas tetramitiformis]